MTTTVYAGRFDFEDGGTYCGGWEDGKAHGHGVCTGPKSMGEFSGVWQYGYEVSGIYIWPSGNCYQGQWMSGKRHGLGVEKKQRWIYKGEWSQGFKGRYGVRISEQSGAKYEGTWANGLQDGYGAETYADTGTYYGQMAQGMRNGYGIRKSVAYGAASRYRSKDIKDSLTSLRSEEEDERTQKERDRKFDENRGGFVLRARSDPTEEAIANAAAHGGIVSTALSGLLKGRRNSFGHNNSSQERRVSLRKTIMSKFSKQKSVNDIDEVNPAGGIRAASAGRAANKKSSFRSTSSNNSVDSRTSNRTAPPGVGPGIRAASTPAGGAHHHTGGGAMDDGENSFISQDEITDVNCIEIYMGEWKQDKRTGYGIAERSDGLKYEGEWFNNKKVGYGVTTFKDGTKEEGKYKNNVLINEKKKGKLSLLRTSKNRERIDNAVNAALKAAQIAQQRADIAISRAKNARAKAESAELAAKQARIDSEVARMRAHEVAPDFIQPGELKKMPEIFLEIDKHGIIPGGVNIDIPSNNISPMPYRRPNSQIKQLMEQQQQQAYSNTNTLSRIGNTLDSYKHWQPQTPQQQPVMQHYYNNTSSSTPPTMIRGASQQQQNQIINNNKTMNFLNDQIDAQQQQQYYNNPNISSNNPHDVIMQQQQQQQHNKMMNDMLGLNPHLDPQTAAVHMQMQQQQQQQLPNYIHNNNNPYAQHHGYLQQTQSGNISFDEDPNQLLIQQQQQQQRYLQQQNFLFNNNSVDINNNNPYLNNQQQISSSFDDPILNSNFQRTNPKRNTLKRSQRVMDSSVEDFNNNNSNSNSAAAATLTTTTTTAANNNSSSQSNNNNKSSDINSNYLRAPSLPRRKSLPSIVKNQAFKEDEIAHSSSDLNNKTEELFIIENGIRKRITETSNPSLIIQQQQHHHQLTGNNNNNNRSSNAASAATAASSIYKAGASAYYNTDDTSPKLPRKMIIESITSLNAPDASSKLSSKRVSMPSINALLSPKFANKVMSREEANRLSSLQREHNRKHGKTNESSNIAKLKSMFPNDTISMFFKTTIDCSIQTDEATYFSWLKDIFNRHRLFLAIIIFNISLAIWFFQLLK